MKAINTLPLGTLLAWKLMGAALLASGAETNALPFYICHADPRPGWPGSSEAIAKMVKGLGYDGMGALWLSSVPEALKAWDSAALKLSQIYIDVDLRPNERQEFGGAYYDPRLKSILPLLKGRDAQLVLMFGGLKPSKPATDRLAVHVVREIADLAQGVGVKVLLANIDSFPPQISLDDVRVLAEKVDRPNVGVMFSLFEWLVITPDRNYEPLLRRAMPKLMAVGISGADEIGDTSQAYLQPLGEGTFEMAGFLRTLRRLGYHGPIVLESQNIQGDRLEVFGKSIHAWQKYSRVLEETMPIDK